MSQVVIPIIFAVAAAFVLYQLYAVLGRRVGRQPEDMNPAPGEPRPLAAPDEDRPDLDESEGLTGLAALRARDPSFDTGRFLSGARSAYEMIVRAFTERDRETLQHLVAPGVYEGFERAMDEREKAGETATVEFLQPPRADLEGITVEANAARIKVRFLAEHRVRTKSEAGEAVDDRRTAEVWSFERNLKSRDPNWLLVRVDAAEE